MKKKWQKKLRRYSGAGILVTARDTTDELLVLLGKRRFNPGKGKWSIPGGKKDRGDSDFKAAAIRELNEEISIKEAEKLKPEQLSRVFILLTFIFNWKTYHWHIDEVTPPKVMNGRHAEFQELQWFPAYQLPEPLHWGVKSAVKRAVRLSD